MMERGCGIFLPIASVSNNSGFGTFSKETYDFIDYLSENNFKYWQILPLTEMDENKASTCPLSSFAIDPIYIDAEKFMTKEELEFFKMSSTDSFELFREKKNELLKYLFDKLYFETNLDKFIQDNQDWVYDYAVFKCLKDELKCPYSDFPDCYKNIDSGETISFIKTHSEELVYYIFLQYVALKQWKELKKYASSKGVKIISSASIFSNANGADAYANKNEFLMENGKIVDFNNYYGELEIKNQSIESLKSSPKNATYEPQNMPSLAMFNGHQAKQTKFAFLTKKFKWLSKLYDFILIENATEFNRFFACPKLALSNEHKGTVIVNSSLEKARAQNPNLKIYNISNYNSELKSNTQNLTQKNSEENATNYAEEFFEILKENKIKFVLEIYLEKSSQENDFCESVESTNKKTQNLSKNDEISGKKAQKSDFYVTKIMQFAFTNNLAKENLPSEFLKNTVAYLETQKQNKFSDFLEDENVKSKVCAYLSLPQDSSNETITKMAMENLLSSDANVVILSSQDIFENYSDFESAGFYDFRLKKNFKEEPFVKYLKELIKNKNR